MKVWNYILITTGMMFLLYVMGFNIGGVNSLLNTLHLTTNQDITTSPLYNFIFGSTGILILIAVSIGVGFLTSGRPENIIIAPIISTHFVLWLGSMISIIVYANSTYSGFIGTIITAILGVLSVGYLIALVEFFRGSD